MVQNRRSNTITMPNMCCPICQRTLVTGLYMFPLSFRDLEESGALRRRCAIATVSAPPQSKSVTDANTHVDIDTDTDACTTALGGAVGMKRKREGNGGGGGSAENLDRAQAAAAPFVGLLQSMASDHHSGEAGRHHSRTGRWTAEEMAYADHLIRSFEGGLLSVPQGVKLNEFLSDFLMCKSSRLTKKMKNAKLSTRSYTFGDWRGGITFCCATLSQLQDLFLRSVPTGPIRLELKFNLSRMWRVHFSNLCLQLGYETLRADDWLKSLEEMERRSIHAEDQVRVARRLKMGLALRKDSLQDCLDGVFFGGVSPGKVNSLHVTASLVSDANSKSTGSGLLGSAPGLAPGPAPGLSAPNSAVAPPSAPSSMTLSALSSRQQSMVVPNPNVVPPQYRMEEIDSVRAGPALTPSPIEPNAFVFSNMPTTTLGGGSVSGRPGLYQANPGKGQDQSQGQGQGKSQIPHPRLPSDADLSRSRPRLYSEDLSLIWGGENDPLSAMLDVNAFDPPETTCGELRSGSGPFINRVIEYMELNDLPFQHVDVWVPSFNLGENAVGNNGNANPSDSFSEGPASSLTSDPQKLHLCNAGYSSRTDISNPQRFHNLHEFGLYSANFSFFPGFGMPGRVYSTGIPTWENSIQNASPEHFKRCGGAKVSLPIFSSFMPYYFLCKILILSPPCLAAVSRELYAFFVSVRLSKKSVGCVRLLFLFSKHFPLFSLVLERAVAVCYMHEQEIYNLFFALGFTLLAVFPSLSVTVPGCCS